MFITRDFYDYTILDCGGGEKLERWGEHILARPDPQAIWEPSFPQLWKEAHARYHRSQAGGGQWEFMRPLPEKWRISYKNLTFAVRPTGFKHTGLFPEQAANWDFLAGLIGESAQPVRVLNLFAYTGGATMACAAAGASVTHVDAAKSMVAWAKENAALCGLSDRPIRYIVDDCLKFVLREQRRGNSYEGIIMDPPSYGRGADGQVWKMERDLFGLIKESARLLSDNALFFLVNSYTTGLSPIVTKNMLELTAAARLGGRVEAGELALPVENSAVLLPCGSTARWTNG